MVNLEELQSKLLDGEKAWLDNWLLGQGEPPGNCLFHYTDSRGLLGILKDRKFWGTNVLYLNDRSEITHCAELIRSRVDLAMEGLSGPIAALLANVRNDFNSFDVLTAFVACFSEEGDQLSQWRGYGYSGGGYSVGISPRRGRAPDRVPRISLRKVIYDK